MKIVAAVADVLHEPERMVPVADCQITERGVRQSESVPVQETQRGPSVKSDPGESVFAEADAQGTGSDPCL